LKIYQLKLVDIPTLVKSAINIVFMALFTICHIKDKVKFNYVLITP